MNNNDIITSLLAGIALSACCGFRIFIPLMLGSFGVRFGIIADSWITEATLNLIKNDVFVTALTIASVLEMAAYNIPYLDNILDTIATPLAIIAATLLSSSFFTFSNEPYMRFILGAITGGAAAGIIQTSTSLLRLGSTKFTAGLGNPFFSTLESLIAFMGAVVAIFLPLVGIIFIVLCCWGFIWGWKKFGKLKMWKNEN